MTRGHGVTRAGIVALACGLAMALALIVAGAAQANAPITSYTAVPSDTQAGGHPDLLVHFTVENRLTQKSQSPCNCEDAKDATVHTPAGFIGNPHATPQCSIADFSSNQCPVDSQIGVVHVEIGLPGQAQFVSALYNVVPPPGVAGWLAFKVYLFDAPQFTVLSARTDGDYGLDATATSIFHGLSFPLLGFTQVLWGVPADPVHDALRLNPQLNPQVPPGGRSTAYEGALCDKEGARSTDDPNTVYQSCQWSIPPQISNSPPTPFLQNPTNCDAPLSSSLDVLSYDGGTDHAEAPWPRQTGCSQLSFNPSLYAQPTTRESDSPSGVDVNLSIPQELSPTVPSPSELRAATIVLPPGFSINPNAADGKLACTEAEAHFGLRDEGSCPETSKVGSLVIDSSALPGPLPGYVYLGQPLPGNRYRIFLIANGFATHIKVAGVVSPDPATGQLAVKFQDLPQSPLTAFNMHFFGSERGILATPTACGTYPVTSTFTPWDSSLPALTSSQFFTIDSGPEGQPCPGPVRPFSPTFQAASLSHVPGAHSPFEVELRRADGDQNLAGLTVQTPPGFSGALKGIPYCPQSAIDSISNPLYPGLSELTASLCPAASQIGTAVAGAGAGTQPLYVPGKVYLAGPYKGAPLSLVVVVPSVAGPYDLGNVVVRAAIEVDPHTAQVTTVSDPLPQIIEGIPLRARVIRVNLDRPGFALNPTNCEHLSVDAQVTGDQGGTANLSNHFQMANCAGLPFEPKLSIRLSGGLKRLGHPAIRAIFRSGPGQANVRKVSVTLPNGELLDNAHIRTICTRVAFAAENCPPGSIVGRAKAVTPLLDEPLEGLAYLRSSSNELPDLAVALKGQVDFELAGKIDSVNGRLRSTFQSIPDVPVSEFVLDLVGGKKGLLINSNPICGRHLRALVKTTGQNGARMNTRTELRANCGSRSSRRRHPRGAHGRDRHPGHVLRSGTEG